MMIGYDLSLNLLKSSNFLPQINDLSCLPDFFQNFRASDPFWISSILYYIYNSLLYVLP